MKYFETENYLYLSIINIWFVTFTFFKKKKIFDSYFKIFFISEYFIKIFPKFPLIRIFSQVSSNFSESFHEISLKCLKNIRDFISVFRRIVEKFPSHFLISKIY